MCEFKLTITFFGSYIKLVWHCEILVNIGLNSCKEIAPRQFTQLKIKKNPKKRRMQEERHLSRFARPQGVEEFKR